MTLPGTENCDPSDFDPHTVPTFPVVPVRVLLDDDGTTRAEFNGQRIDVPPGQDPIAALMGQAAIAAGERPLRAIRIAATDTADRTWPVVVHADGRTWDMSPTAAPQRRTRRTLVTIAAVTALAVVLTGAAGAVIVSRSGENTATTAEPTTPPPGPPGESPVVPVDGWTRRAVWTSPALVNDTAPLVTDTAIVTQTQSRDQDAALTGLDPDTGGILWQTPLASRLDQAPDLAEVNGANVISATSGDQLLLWDEGGTPLQRYELPPDATLVPESTAPLVYSEREAIALTLDGDTPVRRVLPAGATPISADGQGDVYAVDDLGNWWTLTAERTAPSPQRLQAPSAEALPVDVLGVVGRTLVVLYAAAKNEDEARFTLAGYGLDTDLSPVWATTVEQAQTTDWHPDPAGAWAVLGRTSINTETGETTQLPEDWATEAITSKAAWSLTGDTGYVAKPASKAQPLTTVPDATGFPVAIDHNHALILATTANTPRLYALQPDTGKPYDATSTTAPADRAEQTQAPTDDAIRTTAPERPEE